MKVDELRKLLKESNEDNIRMAFVEVYKSLPKAKKEEIDETMIQLLQGIKEKKVKKEEVKDLNILFEEIEYFTKCAYNDLYHTPNRIISKQERSKWRFKVKNYIKELKNVKVDDIHFNSSNEALIKIYEMLSYGCSYYIFNTDDPFASVEISQTDLYGDILERIKLANLNEELIRKIILNGTTPHLSRDTISFQLIYQIPLLIESNNDRNYLINLSKTLISELEIRLNKYDSLRNFLSKQRVANINQLIFLLIDSLTIDDYKYYYNHAHEYDNEVALYIGLKYLDDEDWINFYEYSCKKCKIKPRKELVEEYNKRKEEL